MDENIMNQIKEMLAKVENDLTSILDDYIKSLELEKDVDLSKYLEDHKAKYQQNTWKYISEMMEYIPEYEVHLVCSSIIDRYQNLIREKVNDDEILPLLDNSELVAALIIDEFTKSNIDEEHISRFKELLSRFTIAPEELYDEEMLFKTVGMISDDVNDVYDEYDITEWVKDNCEIEDVYSAGEFIESIGEDAIIEVLEKENDYIVCCDEDQLREEALDRLVISELVNEDDIKNNFGIHDIWSPADIVSNIIFGLEQLDFSSLTNEEKLKLIEKIVQTQ